MLSISHDYWLIAASLAVAFMAGFTGLSLMRGASELGVEKRKIKITLAAIALGGGIWSMHFIAMLGMQLPILFYYDPLVTLLSALIAILVVGAALLLLHFWKRTSGSITASGALVGMGILAMHYLGMSGIQLCMPIYTPFGILIAVVTSIALSIGAFWVAYGQRTARNIVLGTVIFGLAVFSVHFVAMAGTNFVAVDAANTANLLIGNESLALIVAIGSFILCGAFLLNTVTFLSAKPSQIVQADQEPSAVSLPPSPPVEDQTVETDADTKHAEIAHTPNRVPFEKNGKTYFIDHSQICAIRAEGHYTILYSEAEKLFCPWSISEAASRLTHSEFIRTHRSYLVNPRHVSEFERKKDNGICYFHNTSSLEKVPVSRSNLSNVRESLGLS